MVGTTVVTATHKPIDARALGLDTTTLELVERARAADELDHTLTVRQTLRKYKTATIWSVILSTALIMEGYDLVMVGLEVL